MVANYHVAPKGLGMRANLTQDVQAMDGAATCRIIGYREGWIGYLLANFHPPSFASITVFELLLIKQLDRLRTHLRFTFEADLV